MHRGQPVGTSGKTASTHPGEGLQTMRSRYLWFRPPHEGWAALVCPATWCSCGLLCQLGSSREMDHVAAAHVASVHTASPMWHPHKRPWSMWPWVTGPQSRWWPGPCGLGPSGARARGLGSQTTLSLGTHSRGGYTSLLSSVRGGHVPPSQGPGVGTMSFVPGLPSLETKYLLLVCGYGGCAPPPPGSRHGDGQGLVPHSLHRHVLPSSWDLGPHPSVEARLCLLVLLEGAGCHLISAPSPCSWCRWLGLRTGPGTRGSVANTWDRGPRLLPTLGGMLGSVMGLMLPETDGFWGQEGMRLWELQSSILGVLVVRPWGGHLPP